MTGHTPMPWGAYKGKPLADVPPAYLLWLYQDKKAHGKLKEYINLNMAAIRSAIAKKK